MSGAIAFPTRLQRRVDGWSSVATAAAIATVLAIVAIAFGWRGSDLPAQVFRSDLIRRDGFTLWNSQWFGGHNVLGYSVIAPPIAAVIGPLSLIAVSGVVAAVVFERILRFTFGSIAWVGAIWFAFGTSINLVVGRVTYALGFTLGLCAVYAFQRRHTVIAVLCALLCALSSPLAGAFLVVAAGAAFLAQRDRRAAALALGAGAAIPLLVTTVLFPNQGAQPYEPWAFIWDLCLFAILAIVMWDRPVVRWGAACFAALATLSFLIATPMGGNVSRLGQYVGGPLLACALLARGRRLLLVALAIPLLIWQGFPAVDGVAYASHDPSTKAAYYQPMIDYIKAQGGPIGRVEIPSTYRHWEAAYAAPDLLLARGWERQLDIAYNKIFYEDLTVVEYQQWLRDNAIAYVALPDARLDDSSLAERDILLAGYPFLTEVWSNANWRVWKVNGFMGLAHGAATLRELSPDRMVLDVHEPGDVLVRVRGASKWKVPDGGCARSTKLGWTVLKDLPLGEVVIRQSLTGSPCPKT
ncbi:MAG TPA: hypothetical protein VNC41_16565 [Acidimicrobiia bacterium]|nr:hypothetical protein [Acidimicrobiia bacterium]